MSKTISINDARIDTDVFKSYNQEAQNYLEQIHELQEDYKELVETVQEVTKIKKSDVSGYFKARFKDKQKEAVKKGDLYEALNEALEN